jgi:hypothetical protein
VSPPHTDIEVSTIMKKTLASLPPAPVKRTLVAIYVIALAMAIVPPLYFSFSGNETLFLGLPLAIVYWIFDALIVALSLCVLYLYEDARGELDEVISA